MGAVAPVLSTTACVGWSRVCRPPSVRLLYRLRPPSRHRPRACGPSCASVVPSVSFSSFMSPFDHRVCHFGQRAPFVAPSPASLGPCDANGEARVVYRHGTSCSSSGRSAADHPGCSGRPTATPEQECHKAPPGVPRWRFMRTASVNSSCSGFANLSTGRKVVPHAGTMARVRPGAGYSQRIGLVASGMRCRM